MGRAFTWKKKDSTSVGIFGVFLFVWGGEGVWWGVVFAAFFLFLRLGI